MSQFLGTHQNRLDPKFRVSVPAAFRAALKAQEGGTGLILRPSHNHPCVEAWTPTAFATLETQLNELAFFSESRDALAASLYADAWRVEADKDGRVMLPPDLVAHARLGETVTFMGMGPIFHIWEPAAAAAFREAARGRANLMSLTLPAVAA